MASDDERKTNLSLKTATKTTTKGFWLLPISEERKFREKETDLKAAKERSEKIADKT